jgi:signal peptidase I
MTAAFVGLALATGLALASWVRWRLIVTEVSGPSMQPTYRDGDRLLSRRRVRRSLPNAGQVIVFRNPRPVGVPGSSSSPLLIKRVAAAAGDAVPHGRVDERVPDRHVMVLGDNPAQSLDSRQLGFIPVENIVATVIRPLSRRR